MDDHVKALFRSRSPHYLLYSILSLLSAGQISLILSSITNNDNDNDNAKAKKGRAPHFTVNLKHTPTTDARKKGRAKEKDSVHLQRGYNDDDHRIASSLYLSHPYIVPHPSSLIPHSPIVTPHFQRHSIIDTLFPLTSTPSRTVTPEPLLLRPSTSTLACSSSPPSLRGILSSFYVSYASAPLSFPPSLSPPPPHFNLISTSILYIVSTIWHHQLNTLVIIIIVILS